ncbi:MAG TPA: biopolymer transporter ExbD [Pseudoxanthomonas sp.]
MAFSASVRDSALAEINITPLVDVMLVLLVIFMVTAPLVTQPLDASLPQATPPITIKPQQLLLEIADDGSYRLDGRLMTRDQLRERLQTAAADDARTALSVRATSNADYQRMVTALAEAQDSGITHIGVQP